ncbi:hypothetical protein [Glaciecola petra]|uniref:SGNH hydrolase-type esterase domain-containing protein n=1 Tax=Glaciecola petra TaxID=3075602 RepID=A0ABU2ZQY1_9ALTE|nr:hypothetical protein [Aestuariibacter sp. P117]MDT0595048.1 hypothetical protein [Aestuariibacter sp. P117]
MPKETAIQRRRRQAATTGVTSFRSDFNYMCRRHSNRIGIVTEGDSWFDYPRRWLLFGPDINVVHHIEAKIIGTDKVNLLRMASNGDRAEQMMSGSQKKVFETMLRRNSKYINLILFSGGGNDIVGKRNLPPLLNEYQTGFTAHQCIKQDAFEKKLNKIFEAYATLMALRSLYVPHAKVVTHCYDIAAPSEAGARFLWGLIDTKSWIYPFLVEKSIPEDLHIPIVKILLGRFRERLIAFTQLPKYLEQIYMVDTQGLLRPGNRDDWLNEIHPTESGFKTIATPIYDKMKDLYPDLP